MEGIKVQQPGQREVRGCGVKRMMPRPFRTLSLVRSPALARLSGSGSLRRAAQAAGLAERTFLRSGSFMARGASSAMACAVYEPLSGLEIDCLS